MENQVIMHVNYMEQGQTIEEICEKAVRFGFDGVEFRRKIKDMKDEEYLEKLARQQEKSKLKYVLFGGPGPNLMDENPDVRKKELDEAINFYKKASKYFKLTVCNIMTGVLVNPSYSYFEFDRHGSFFANEKHWHWAIEGFKILGDLAEQLNFYFAFETHMCFLHDTIESSRKLVDLIDKKNVGINLDYANIICFKNPPSIKEAVERCGEKLYYVHLKNLFKIDGIEYKNYIGCSLSDGIINYREFLKILRDKNYTGFICIEAPRQGDREYFAKQDLDYIKQLLYEI
ncbi:MAG: sugar phosphate isomerase/epimerase [Candidatus Omnitrophica bacterium]|nr:sugar phosphate isomerase/epimerase [Candidatus Omnitrophota bacterium]MCM8802166.1 sugar phosphate isomerase/epimerase [Candidatus Omnitrophota bacterium]